MVKPNIVLVLMDNLASTNWLFSTIQFSSSLTTTIPTESVIIYVGNDLYGVKWRNWKMSTKTLSAGFFEPVNQYSPLPLFFDLLTDPKEEHPTDLRLIEDLWVRYPMAHFLVERLASLKKEPPIPPCTLDHYIPATNVTTG